MQNRVIKPAHFVTSVDTFMSGWGRSSDKTNLCVCECYSISEAESVKAYAKSRSDQESVKIVTSRPREVEGVLISETNGWVETAARKGF